MYMNSPYVPGTLVDRRPVFTCFGMHAVEAFCLTASFSGETAPANKSKMRGLNNFIQVRALFAFSFSPFFFSFFSFPPLPLILGLPVNVLPCQRRVILLFHAVSASA